MTTAAAPEVTHAEPVTTPLDPALQVPSTQAPLVPITAPVEDAPSGDKNEAGSAFAPADVPQHQWTPEQVQLLKDTVCKGATDNELRLFSYVCQRRKLDPFTKQIHAIKRRVKEGNSWRDSITFQTGIDGFRLIAERTGLYEGQGPFEWCGADNVWRDVWLSKEAPLAARCAIFRKGFREPIRAVALFSEYVQLVEEYVDEPDEQNPQATRRRKTGKYVPNTMWQQRPAGQLAKCAEALGFRIAFPEELSGLYTHDEMAQADNSDRETYRYDGDKPVPGSDIPPCPACGKAMWDNRARKAKGGSWKSAPDFRCKDRDCGGEIMDAKNPPQRATSEPRSDVAERSNAEKSASTAAATSTSATSPTPSAATDDSGSTAGSKPTLAHETGLDHSPLALSITRDTVIDWGVRQTKVVNGKTLGTLLYEQLQYFTRHLDELPVAWHRALADEIFFRETGDDGADGDGSHRTPEQATD